MANKAFFGQDARNRVEAGMKLAYDIVKEVQGPRSGNVGIGHTFYSPDITHDGITVLEAINIDDKDPAELGQRVGVELMKEASRNVNNLAGDGTTTVSVLTYNILKEANKAIAVGNDPQAVRRGVDAAAKQALEELEKHVIDISDNPEAVRQIAVISAGDKEIGELVADVVNTVGATGTISVQTDEGSTLEKEITEGFSFDYGLASPLYATDQTKKHAEYNYPAIVIISGTVQEPMELKPLIDGIMAAGQEEIVFIIDEMSREVSHALSQNRANGAKIVVVKAPGHGESRQEALADIAAFTGAKVLNSEIPLGAATTDAVGRCESILVETDKTTIYKGKGGELIKARIAEIKKKKARRTATELDKQKYDERIAKLSSKAAIIKVGGVTETAINETKDRVDDAVAAAQGALADGVVIGGGVMLVRLSQKIKPVYDMADEEKLGFAAFKQALVQPFRQILANAGLNADALLQKVIEDSWYRSDHGIDVLSGRAELINLREAGVIDPIRVTREAIKQSASVAGSAATMSVLIVELPDERVL